MFVATVGCAAKQADVPLADIPKLQSLDEIMHANETIGGSIWSLQDKETFSAEDWANATDASARMAALAARSKEFSRGDAFNKYADILNTQAKSLGAASEKQDPKAAAVAIGGMKDACRDCHAETR